MDIHLEHHFEKNQYQCFLIYIKSNCHNCIVKECLNVRINNSNTIIGYKLACMRPRFGINVIDTGYDVCLHNIIGTQFTAEQQNLVNCNHTLIFTRSNNFSNNYINYMIDYIAIN